jgi:hypothetical protein
MPPLWAPAMTTRLRCSAKHTKTSWKHKMSSSSVRVCIP